MTISVLNFGSKLANDAYEFVRKAHSKNNQLRKYTYQDYIVHPISVAMRIKKITDNPNMIAAALLHDVVEDTVYTIQDIEFTFGPIVADLVGWLTNVSKPEDGNRKKRVQIDIDHIAKAPADAKTIRLADVIDNLIDIETNDPDFAIVYMKEKAKLLEVLTEGNSILYKQASEIIKKFNEENKGA